MQRRMMAAALVWIAAAGTVPAGNLGAHWTHWRTRDAGENDGLGFKLTLTEQGTSSALELRVARFSDLSGDGDPGTLKVTPLEIGTRFPVAQDGPLEIYLGLGVGYYLMDHDTAGAGDEFGYYGLLGMEFRLGKSFLVFGEGTYRRVKARLSGTPDLRLDGIGMNLGVGFHW